MARAALSMVAPHNRILGRREFRGIPRTYQTRIVPRSGFLFYAKRPADSLRRAAQPRLILLTPSIPMSVIRRRAPRSMDFAPRISTELHNGDEVVIACSEPRRSAVCLGNAGGDRTARSAIRRATREAVQRAICRARAQIVERAFKRAGKPFRRRQAQGGVAALVARSQSKMFSLRSGAVKCFRASGLKRRPSRISGGARFRCVMPAKAIAGWFGLKSRSANLIFKCPAARRGRFEARSRSAAASADLPVRFAPKAARCRAKGSSAS